VEATRLQPLALRTRDVGRLEGQVAIVTGGSRGIGRAIVAAFAGEGARVVATGRDRATGDAAAAEIGGRPAVMAAGGRVTFHAGDVSDERRVGEIVTAVLDDNGGRLDILVNNAAVQHEARLLDQTTADFHRVVNANLLGTFLFSRAALPPMIAQGRGVMINLSSVLGLVGDPLLPVYAATKAGILGFTRSVAVAYAEQGIRVVAICPGDVDTELNQQYFASQPDPVAFRRQIEAEYPAKRIAQPDEIARVAVFLATDDASFINGSHVVVEGGILARLYPV
jgi:NAD(P)-dependent dehydrogenase (short-subunit alcohol dehydrogenase family)